MDHVLVIRRTIARLEYTRRPILGKLFNQNSWNRSILLLSLSLLLLLNNWSLITSVFCACLFYTTERPKYNVLMHIISENSIKNCFEMIIALTKGCHCKKKIDFPIRLHLFVRFSRFECLSSNSNKSQKLLFLRQSDECGNLLDFFFVLIEIIQHNSNKPKRAMFQCFMNWDKIVRALHCISFGNIIWFVFWLISAI